MNDSNRPGTSNTNYTLGSIDSKLDALLGQFQEHRMDMKAGLASHEKRISEVERWRSRQTGLFAGVGFVIAALYGLVFKVLALI